MICCFRLTGGWVRAFWSPQLFRPFIEGSHLSVGHRCATYQGLPPEKGGLQVKPGFILELQGSEEGRPMPIHFNDLDVVSEVAGLSSALIVPCYMCPAVTIAVREKEPFIQFFRHFLKSAPFEQYLTTLQSRLKKAWRGNRSIQELSLSRMVHVHVDLGKAEEAAKMCGTI